MIPGFDTLREVKMSEPTDVRLMPHHAYKSWTTFWYGPDRLPGGVLRKHTKRFGKAADMTKAQARSAFRRWYDEDWTPRNQRGEGGASLYTVKNLADDFYAHAQDIYKKHGEVTTHVGQVKRAMEQLADAHGTEPADALTGPALHQLLKKMLAGGMYKRDGGKLTVRTVNGRLTIIKQAYKWARQETLVSAVTMADVVAVTPLNDLRTPDARKTDDVAPVSREVVDATMKGCGQGLRDLVELLWLSGMRPGEGCNVRPCDVDRSKAVWVYTPHTHKTEHKDKRRRIALGPQAQAILSKYMLRSPATYCFLTSSCLFPDGSGPGRLTSHRPMYPDRLNRFLWHACDKAKVGYWTANQLRHAWATRMRELYSIETVSDGLGHSSVDITEIYAERSLKRAMEVASACG